MLVFIRKLSLSSLIWVPICQSFSHFTGFLHYFVFLKLATSFISVNFMLERIYFNTILEFADLGTGQLKNPIENWYFVRKRKNRLGKYQNTSIHQYSRYLYIDIWYLIIPSIFNPFMPVDLIDVCHLDLSHFRQIFFNPIMPTAAKSAWQIR